MRVAVGVVRSVTNSVLVDRLTYGRTENTEAFHRENDNLATQIEGLSGQHSKVLEHLNMEGESFDQQGWPAVEHEDDEELPRVFKDTLQPIVTMADGDLADLRRQGRSLSQVRASSLRSFSLKATESGL